ncbi:MAG: hypothetical protein OEV41_02575, partial [Gammaproteobacteria bacterium]|nr:hypothetical protein [Gammaproteobacteria bacterium]
MARLTGSAAAACAIFAFAQVSFADSVLSRDGIQSMRLSPSGNYIAVHSRSDTNDSVVIHDAETLAVNATYETSAPVRIGSTKWVSDAEALLALASDRQYEISPVPVDKAVIIGVNGEHREATADESPAATPRLSAVVVDEGRFDDLLGTLYAGPAQTAISVADASENGSRLIVRTRFNNRQDEFSVVTIETGARRRILKQGGGLYFAGGTAEETYDQIAFSTTGGDPVSGFAAVRRGTESKDYPTVVLLQREPGDYAWDGGFDDEIDFFSRQRITVLTINSLAGDAELASHQIRDAIRWSAAEGHTQDNRVCIVGRGAGGSLAVLAGVQLKGVRCAISIGGDAGGSAAIAQLALEGKISNRAVDVLLVSGADESAGYLAEIDRFAGLLRDHRVGSETLLVAGERRDFANRRNEVRALAAASLLVDGLFGKFRVLAALPMTRTQSRDLQAIFNEFNKLARTVPTNEAIGWLDRRDSDIRALLSPEQWLAY